MVFESLINPKKAEGHPWELFILGFFYSTIAIFFSMFLFKEYAGIVSITIMVLASTYLLVNVIKFEEKKDIKIKSEILLLKSHGKFISIFLFLFLGFTLSFSMWYVLLPHDLGQEVFKVQINTLSKIENEVTGNIGFKCEISD